MSARVNLLLLLSALLSALTGVGATAPAQDRAPTVAEGSVNAARAAATARRLTTRPTATLPTLHASAAAAITPALPLAPREPLYATRRRE